MKNIFLSFLFLFSIVLWSQKREVNVSWQQPKSFSPLLENKVIPFFNSKNYDFNPVSNELLYVENFDISIPVDPTSLIVSNVDYENISIKELGDLRIQDLPNMIQPKLENIFYRDKIKASFSFFPIIKQGNEIKRVKSIQYTFKEKLNRTLYSQASASQSKINSVLQKGNWFKFYVVYSGVYKISKSFLNKLGVPSDVDPRTISVYGNGGKMLPLLNSDPVSIDLQENAIQVIGEEDGVFNDSDYILFYAEGVDQWSQENLTHLNLYDTKSYYYITYGGNPGKRITLLNQPSAEANINYTSYDGYVYHEKDIANIGHLGRKWFGENFVVNNQQNFNLEMHNFDNSQNVKVTINAASASFSSSSFTYSIEGQNLGTVFFSRIEGKTTAAYENSISKNIQLNNNQAVVNVTYNNGGIPSSQGFLDFISLEYNAKLSGGNKQFQFSNKALAMESGVAQYSMNNASQVAQIWDITDIYNVKALYNNQANLNFKVQGGSVRKFQTIVNSDFYEPLLLPNSRVDNQDLKGTIFNEGDIDYIIITHSSLKSAADRLANYHRDITKLKVKVVELSHIYEEFSSGKQDVAAIRNFIKYVYNNASSPNKRLRYVNMFGDASYDYKDRISNNRNIVPVFYGMQPYLVSNSDGSGANFSAYTTFMSDDFYVLMDDDEGLMLNANYGLDIAIGRMLATNLEEANVAVAKLLEYNSKESQGTWRNVMLFLADDVDTPIDFIMQVSTDDLVDKISEIKPFFNVKKIYMDSYIQKVSAGGKRYPEVKKDFISGIESGALVVNYFGHGGEEGLAHERVFGLYDALKLRNHKKYPLFITITCEFTRFDNPSRLTGGEGMFKNRRGGAIALVATTREIGMQSGRDFNELLGGYMFPSNNDYITVSEALMYTKNDSPQRDKNVVFFIGDPAFKLAIPRPKVELTEINDVPFDEYSDNLEALGHVKLSGELRDENNNFLNNFNGNLFVQIFDKDIHRQTLANDRVGIGGKMAVMEFKTLGETIFRGNALVEQGKFSFDFILPKDIKIAVGNGKISFYAQQDNDLDYTGSNNEIKIGGINLNAPEDKTPPVVKLYMDNEQFIYGGETSESPLFLAYLDDENGINTSSGIGHDLVFFLDGDEGNPYVVNDFYETEPNNFRKGIVKYPLKDLENGLHTITFRAWDVYNNLTTAEIQFTVYKDERVILDKVLNYPNPFVNYTEFWFNHNRPYEDLEVQVQIMTVTGKVVKTINQTVVTQGNLSREVKWDGLDDFGDKIGKGVYLYRLTVKSTVTNQKSEKIEKLVIL